MILIALGANLPSAAGPPEASIHAALAALTARQCAIVRVSPFYRTAAWPDPSDPAFVNAVAELQTVLAPAPLLATLHEVEREFGRDRSANAHRNAPRTLDLDLLDYHGRIEAGPPQLPHPGIETRAFVLVPLRDVAPNWRHPKSGRTPDELLFTCPPDDLPPVRMI